MLFGSSGIRQLYSHDLLVIAQKVGAVLGGGEKEIILGRDTRTTGEALFTSCASGITGAGGTISKAGICPTPTVAYAARYGNAGCMITASHNPEPYNGLKLFNRDGSSFSQEQQEEVEQALSTTAWTDWETQGAVKDIPALELHTRAILEKRSIREGLEVILDCGNGAGSTMTPYLLGTAGVRTISLNANPSGIFTRPSEPLPENLTYLPDMIRKTGVSCAIVHDGDADRMMAFDGRGRFISGDTLLILFAKYRGAKRVVTTYDASMRIEEIADVKRTPVGDAYVSEQLVRWGDFGGEPSGACIFPEISYCPDGPYAAALLCEMAGEWDLAAEIDAIPTYPVLRSSVECADARQVMYALGATSPTDGIRIDEENGWCLVRASGTEPKIRLTAEGRSLETAKQMLEKAGELLRLARTEMK